MEHYYAEFVYLYKLLGRQVRGRVCKPDLQRECLQLFNCTEWFVGRRRFWLLEHILVFRRGYHGHHLW
jgi:hypothetical protein